MFLNGTFLMRLGDLIVLALATRKGMERAELTDSHGDTFCVWCSESLNGPSYGIRILNNWSLSDLRCMGI